MMFKCRLVCSLLLLFVFAWGCDASPKPSAKSDAPRVVVVKDKAQKILKVETKSGGAPQEPEKKHRYSPFVLKVDAQGSAFDTISFKDVGILLDDDAKDDLYETIAEALAQEVSADSTLKLTSSVNYDEAILDPANHLACGSRHLYVDVWQAKSPDRWGYSLWSGCGDDDNFEWKEVEFNPSKDSLEDVNYLTKSIGASLRVATKKNCYQKTC